MIILTITACLIGQECQSETLAMFTSSGDQREFCEVAKRAFEEKYLPNLKPEDRATFACKQPGK